MLKRKISFINFTVIVCGLIIAAGTICLLLMQKNLIKEDTKYLAYTELAQEVKRAKKNIGFDENENPYIKKRFLRSGRERYLQRKCICVFTVKRRKFS